MPFVEIREHEVKCGSQTEKCAKCNRYIQRKGLTIQQKLLIEKQICQYMWLIVNNQNHPGIQDLLVPLQGLLLEHFDLLHLLKRGAEKKFYCAQFAWSLLCI